jgi:hypothetical protein
MEMECQINNMISKIYNSNYAIWKVGSLKNKTKEEIKKEFDTKLGATPKYKKSVPNNNKRRKILAEKFKQLNPHLFK